jgi:hypothetical protein
MSFPGFSLCPLLSFCFDQWLPVGDLPKFGGSDPVGVQWSALGSSHLISGPHPSQLHHIEVNCCLRSKYLSIIRRMDQLNEMTLGTKWYRGWDLQWATPPSPRKQHDLANTIQSTTENGPSVSSPSSTLDPLACEFPRPSFENRVKHASAETRLRQPTPLSERSNSLSTAKGKCLPLAKLPSLPRRNLAFYQSSCSGPQILFPSLRPSKLTH